MEQHYQTVGAKIKDAFHATDEIALHVNLTLDEANAVIDPESLETTGKFDDWLEGNLKLQVEGSSFDLEFGILTCNVFATDVFVGEIEEDDEYQSEDDYYASL